jgi:hypothetical protein
MRREGRIADADGAIVELDLDDESAEEAEARNRTRHVRDEIAAVVQKCGSIGATGPTHS